MLSKYDNFIFDLGSVLVYLDKERCVSEFKKLGIENAEEYIGKSAQNGVFGDLELGLISEARFYDEIREKAGIDSSNKEIETAWNSMICHTPTRLLECLLALRGKNKKIFLLSNVNPIHIRKVEEEHFRQIEGKNIDSYFDKMFLSHELHLKKPSAEIYNYVINHIGGEKSRIIFFDDNEENVREAKACEIDAKVVPTPDKMIELLESII